MKLLENYVDFWYNEYRLERNGEDSRKIIIILAVSRFNSFPTRLMPLGRNELKNETSKNIIHVCLMGYTVYHIF